MKHFLLALVCVMLMSVPTLAQPYRCDSNGGVCYQTRVMDLPQDQDKFYCTIFGHPNDPEVRQLQKWFDVDPDLNQFKHGTHFALVNSESTMFRQRYATTTGPLPCVRVTDREGNVVFQASGDNLPMTSAALANSMHTTCLRRLRTSPFNLHYHYQDAQPDANPNVTPDVTPDAQPDVFIKRGSFDMPVWAYFVLGIALVVTGIGYEWVKEQKNRG
jgi:hypothetical protein